MLPNDCQVFRIQHPIYFNTNRIKYPAEDYFNRIFCKQAVALR